MNNMKYPSYIIILLCFLGYSCSEKIALTPGIEEFNVSTESTTYKVGDEVQFNFEGNPNIITFYSGELYQQYDFREGRVTDIDELFFSFQTANPTAAGAQKDQFKVLVSTDFNGDYQNVESVEAATWTDLSDQFEYATSGSFRASGDADITSLIQEGQPLYIAYKYITHPQGENGVVRSWLVQNFSLVGNTNIGSLNLGNMTNVGFRIVEKNPETVPTRSAISATRVTLLGPLLDPDNDLYTETWAITKAFNVGAIDEGPDYPLAIKGNEHSRLSSYTHVYEQPGVYDVYFIATNANIDGAAQVIRNLKITITGDPEVEEE